MLRCVRFTVAIVFGCSALVTAQIRQGSEGKHRSVYFSLGVGSSSFSSPSIDVQNGAARYNLSSLEADNGSYTDKSAFVSRFNYSLGYFFDCKQTTAVELSYNPLNYHLGGGSNPHLSGMIDNASINTDISFLPATGNYYYLGCRQLTVNFVKRIPIYHPMQHVVGFDGMLRLGGGPVMTTLDAALPGIVPAHTSNMMSGWNGGVDGGLRITMVRYVYMELSGKYDYAMLNDIKINGGTIKQTITTIQFKAALGFTLPTNTNTKYLFYNVGREHL